MGTAPLGASVAGVSAERPFLDGLPTRIRLIEPIGRGSSAVVWRARDTHVGRDLAVKVLPPVPGLDPVLRGERLEREARALARLRDIDGVVVLHEIGLAADGSAWMVMDLAPNGSLRDRLAGRVDTSGAASEALPLDARSLGARLATTLAHAHAVDVVHGDIAPSNVMLSAENAPLLVDFNMAAILGDGGSDSGPSGFTPAYTAPERLRGAAPDRASDVWSLATTIAAMLQVAADEDDLGPALVSARSSSPGARPSATDLALLLGATSSELPEVERQRRRFGRRR